MMQVMQLKFRVDSGFPRVKASKAYLNDAGDAVSIDDAIASQGEGKQSISQ